ncbi:MAG: ABC transporter permease [Gammaproteobacteria bacterium]
MFTLIWMNFRRNKGKKILTLLSLLIAFVLFGLLMAVKSGMTYASISQFSARRLLTGSKVVEFGPMPVAYAERIAQVPGVEAVTYNGFMAGNFQSPSNFFNVVPVPAQSLFRVYPDFIVPPAQRRAWLQDRTGVLVTPTLLQQFGWNIGEKVPVQTQMKQKDGSSTWYMTIDGVITNRAHRQAFGPTMFMHYSYYDQARAVGEGTVYGFAELLSNAQEAGRVSQAIDDLFTNASPQTRTVPAEASAHNIYAQAGNIGAIVTDVAIAVFFSMMLIVGAIMLHSTRERLSEFAVLRALGFGRATVTGIVVGEAIFTCLVGGIAGLIVAFLLTQALKGDVTQVLSGFSLSAIAIGIGVGLMILFGLVASVLPALQLSRLSVHEALGRI